MIHCQPAINCHLQAMLKGKVDDIRHVTNPFSPTKYAPEEYIHEMNRKQKDKYLLKLGMLKYMTKNDKFGSRKC